MSDFTKTFQLPTTIQLPTAPQVTAQAVVLMDADNGQILYEKNPNTRREPASTTKIMTMLLVMEALHSHKVSWNDIVPVTPDAYKVATEPGVSDAWLDPREKLTLKQMMQYIAVASANDATVAVADYIGGDMPSFVKMMNAKAQKLGLTGTHYENADGLPQADHYTTARDLAVLARYVVEKYPQLLQYSSLPSVTVKNINNGKSIKIPNTDDMVGHYRGLDGLKTGFTDNAGYCFVGTSERNGVRLVSVVMGAKSNSGRFADTTKVLDYGFSQFHEQQIVQKGERFDGTVTVPNGKKTTIGVMADQNLMIDLPAGVEGKWDVKKATVNAPIQKGQTIGEMDYTIGNQIIASESTVAATADAKAGFMTRIWRKTGHTLHRWFSDLLHHL